MWDQDTPDEQWVIGFLKAVGSNPDEFPPDFLAAALPLVPVVRRGRPGWYPDLPLEELAAATFPKLVVSGGHSAGFDAICNDLAKRIGASGRWSRAPDTRFSSPARPSTTRSSRIGEQSGRHAEAASALPYSCWYPHHSAHHPGSAARSKADGSRGGGVRASSAAGSGVHASTACSAYSTIVVRGWAAPRVVAGAKLSGAEPGLESPTQCGVDRTFGAGNGGSFGCGVSRTDQYCG